MSQSGKSRGAITCELFENTLRSSYGRDKVTVSDHNVGVIVRELERGCYSVAHRKCEEHLIDPQITLSESTDYFTHVYSGCVYKVCELLRDQNHELVRAILGRRVQSRNVAGMDMIAIAEYCPSILHEEREDFAVRLAQKTEITTTGLYECSKCHMRRATVQERQTRGSDEPPTLFITCVECHHNWQINN